MRNSNVQTVFTNLFRMNGTLLITSKMAGVDVAVIALWLGHESVRTTDIYQHADLSIKERALERIAQPHTVPGRYRPPDKLLAFLEGL